MRCPTCNADLIVVERDSIEVDWCLDCGGLWFDEGELELLGEKAGRTIDPQDVGFVTTASKEKLRRCPRCPQKMEKIALADGQLIDRCRTHGIWLDRGELAAIVRHLPPSPAADADVVLEFLGEVFEHVTETAETNP